MNVKPLGQWVFLFALSGALWACERPAEQGAATESDEAAKAQTASGPAPDKGGPAMVADYDMQAREVAEGVYAIITPARDFPNPQNKGWNSNSAFVVTDAGVLVFDTGTSETIGTAIKNTIRRVTDKPVRWIIHSHGHGDHWLGNAALAGSHTEIITTPKVRERIRAEQDYWVDLFNRMTEGATGESRAVLPTTVVEKRTRRDFGGVRAELIPSGSSHSPGDLLLWLPEKRVLMAGDVVYGDRAPSTFDADVHQWIRFLEELQALDSEVVIPGHGDVGDVKLIVRLHDYFQSLWEIVETGFEEGKADFEIAPEARERLARFEQYYPKLDENVGPSVSHVYLQVEQMAFAE